jgi:parallel beta-helix repeat protein
MKMLRTVWNLKILVALFLILGSANIVFSATTSGTIPADETWSGTVTLTGDVTVPVGVTLTIEPATEVIFPAGSDDTNSGDGVTSLYVQGSLIAVGAAGSEIYFKSNSSSPAKGDWGSIEATWGLGLKTFDMQYCVVSYSSSGIRWLVKASSAQSATISNCTVEETTGTAIHVYGDSGADITVTVNNNIVRNGDSHGIYAYVSGTSTTLNGTLNGNTISNNDGFGLLCYTYTNAVSNVSINSNMITNSGSCGMYVRTYNYADGTIEIDGNNLDNNGIVTTDTNYRNGLYVHTYQYATGDITITDNTATNNVRYGIYEYIYNQSVGTGTISGNTVSGNNDHGIYLYAQSNNGTSTLVLEGNTTFDNGSYGLYTNSYYANLNLTVSGNTVYGNTYGIYARSDSGSGNVLDALISGNDVHDNSQAGITCYANRQGRVYPEIRGNLVYDNTGAGIQCYRNAGQSVTYPLVPVVTLNEVYGNGGLGVLMQASGGAVGLYNNIHSNGGNGLEVRAEGASSVHYNTIDNNAGSYALVNGRGGAIDGRHNYWGAALTAEMALGDNPKDISGIYDVFNDGGRGAASYEPWLTAAVTLPSVLKSEITYPLDGTTFKASQIEIQGLAVSPNGVDYVEVSTDGGSTWATATGRESWRYDWTIPGAGTYTIQSRVIDLAQHRHGVSGGKYQRHDRCGPAHHSGAVDGRRDLDGRGDTDRRRDGAGRGDADAGTGHAGAGHPAERRAVRRQQCRAHRTDRARLFECGGHFAGAHRVYFRLGLACGGRLGGYPGGELCGQ